MKQLEELLSLDPCAQPPPREEIQRVLTDGYAEALELEAHRLMATRRREGAPDSGEARALEDEIDSCSHRIGELRRRLAEISARYGRNPLGDL